MQELSKETLIGKAALAIASLSWKEFIAIYRSMPSEVYQALLTEGHLTESQQEWAKYWVAKWEKYKEKFINS